MEQDEYLPLKNYDDYEMLTTSPFTIRNIKDKTICDTYINELGYVCVKVGDNSLYLHRLVRTNTDFASLNSLPSVSTFSFDLLPSTITSSMNKLVIDKRTIINYYYVKNNDLSITIYHKFGNKYREVKPVNDQIVIGSINYQYSFIVDNCLFK